MEKKLNKENSSNFYNSEVINFGRFFRLILLQSKMVFVITLAGFFLGVTLYLTTAKTYNVSSLLQVHSPGQSFDPRQSFNLDFFNAPETNLNNLVTLYSSRSNILSLINDLNLNVEIDKQEDKDFLDIKTFLFKKNEKYTKKNFFLMIKDDSFNLLDNQNNVLLKGVNGRYVENDFFEVKLNFPNINSEKIIEITYVNPSNLYNLYRNKLKIKNLVSNRNYWSQEGLLEISFATSDTSEGIKIVNLANEIFIRDNIKVETEKARASMLFIDSQLKGLEEILNLRQSELKSFKQENKSINVNLEVQSIIELISEVEQNINRVDLELSQAEINFTKDNPLYLNLRTQKEALEAQKNNIEKRIKELPSAQQEYVDLFRNLEVSEELYSELITRRLNFSLIEASSIGNIRIVDPAYVKNLIGPRILFTLFLTIFFFLIAIFLAIFRGVFFISISNPAELKDVGIQEKILGVIPHFDNEQSENAQDTKFTQAMETSILNIETIFESTYNEKSSKCRKVVITSPTPGNGKTLFSRSLAESLSNIGHKVLLMDADLKRGVQHRFYDRKTLSREDFQNISANEIEKLKIKNNLYLLPRLERLKNTFEHIYSDTYLSKRDLFETFFDYLIIDTAPALSVSDTGLLMSSSDLNILIIRHQLSKISEVNQTRQIIDQLGRSFDGIVYNDYQKPKGYYGYYDLYGDYSYRYYAERYLYEDYYSKKDD